MILCSACLRTLPFIVRIPSRKWFRTLVGVVGLPRCRAECGGLALLDNRHILALMDQPLSRSKDPVGQFCHLGTFGGRSREGSGSRTPTTLDLQQLFLVRDANTTAAACPLVFSGWRCRQRSLPWAIRAASFAALSPITVCQPRATRNRQWPRRQRRRS
jgi:hypothetical protein